MDVILGIHRSIILTMIFSRILSVAALLAVAVAQVDLGALAAESPTCSVSIQSIRPKRKITYIGL